MRAKQIIACIVSVAALAPVSFTLAQEPLQNTAVGEPSQETTPMPFASEVAGLCGQYFEPTSLVVSTDETSEPATLGAIYNLAGVIENNNPVAVVGATLYAKIFKQEGDSQDVVVDQLLVGDNLSFAANSKNPFTFTWSVPTTIEQGTYYIEYSLYGQNQKALAGDISTDGVTIGTSTFVAGGADAGAIASFSKVNTVINGRSFDFSDTPIVGRNDEVTISTTIENQSATEKTVTLQWLQYADHSMQESNLRYTATEQVIIPAGEARDVTYTLVGQLESKVHLVAQLIDGDSRRILNLPIVRGEGFEVETTFAGVSAFPAVANQPLSLIVCLRTPYADMTPNARVELTLRDQSGTVLSEYEQTSILVSEEIPGFVTEFIPASNLENFSLQVKLLLGDGVIEDYTLTYDCDSFAPEVCGRVTEVAADSTPSTTSLPWTYIVVGVAAVLLSILALLPIIRRKKEAPPAPKEEPLDVPHYK
jgi:hypothetical protein